jgi:hypothetical protein
LIKREDGMEDGVEKEDNTKSKFPLQVCGIYSYTFLVQLVCLQSHPCRAKP